MREVVGVDAGDVRDFAVSATYMRSFDAVGEDAEDAVLRGRWRITPKRMGKSYISILILTIIE